MRDLHMLPVASVCQTRSRRAGRGGATLAAALAAGLAAAVCARAEIEVLTLGGGPLLSETDAAGDVDGDTLQQAQFHSPVACAADRQGFLFVADRDNGKVRRLDLVRNRTRTWLSGLSQPVDVAVDGSNNLYVAVQGWGEVIRCDAYGYPAARYPGFQQPTAIALDTEGTLFVAERDGALRKTSYAGGAIAPVLNGLNRPEGLAFLPNGLLAVSEAGRSAISIYDVASGTLRQRIGDAPGFFNGPANVARFNEPRRIACAPSGTLVVADFGNHRVRTIGLDGRVGTLYGLDPADWGYDHVGFLGWWDGSEEVAESREPSGVALDAEGVVYATELYYHLVRSVTGAGIGANGGTNSLPLLPPAISPNSGYYPMGQNILVTDENISQAFDRTVYYTTDGTDPTTNSYRVELTNNVGTIPWRESAKDLTSLRVRTFLGSASSAVVSGQQPTKNRIGIHRSVTAGPGATTVIPVTVALNGVAPLRSLQFRVEISPVTADAPPFDGAFTPIANWTNALYFPVASPAADGQAAQYLWSAYEDGATRGAAISFLGEGAHLSIDHYAVVALLQASVPADAPEGARYRLTVTQATGTTTDLEREVPLESLPPVDFLVASAPYRVGDTAPGAWYHAGDFGNGATAAGLSNADVNNAFNAALGIRTPYAFTDIYDAMDAFPLDTAAAVGGDGSVRFLDWQVLLKRSLGLDPEPSPWRKWGPGGHRVAATAEALHGSAPAIRTLVDTDPARWPRVAAVGAQTVSNAKPGSRVAVPVYTLARGDASIAGLQFRVSATASAGAAPLSEGMQFEPAPKMPPPLQNEVPVSRDLLCGWALAPSPAFAPALQGSNLLGYLQVPIPAGAFAGAVYSLHFSHVDGAPDDHTQYDFESFPGAVHVLSTAPASVSVASDEWRVAFFAAADAPEAADAADPDEDGFTNAQEYLAGLPPRAADWQFQCGAEEVRLRWFGEAGRQYAIETSVDLRQWETLGTAAGTGGLVEYGDRRDTGRVRFYRVRAAR